MRIDNNETMKMYSPEYVKNVAQANKKAAADNAANEKTVGDDVDISKEGKSLLVTGKEKAERFRQQIRFCTFGDIQEIPAEYKIENLFKMDLRADSIFGGENLFQHNSTSQYKVFDEWLDSNASDMSEEQLQAIKEEIKYATGAIDSLNDQEGYRGTSFESVALLQASKSFLENLKDSMLPEEMRAGFQGMINEYTHFNEAARDSLMQRMTPDYMVVGIGNNTVSYKYKNEIVQSEKQFYNKESADISSKFSDYYSGRRNKEEFLKDIGNYVSSFYNKHDTLVGTRASAHSNAQNLLRKLTDLVR